MLKEIRDNLVKFVPKPIRWLAVIIIVASALKEWLEGLVPWLQNLPF